jgi:integrase/recombinase XerC
MQKRPLTFRESDSVRTALSVRELDDNADGWLIDLEIRQASKATLALRRIIVSKLVWYLRHGEHAECSTNTLRRFFQYLGREPGEGGRWGNEQQCRPVKPGTVATYHRNLKSLFVWLVNEHVIDASPMDAIAPPIDRADQIQPFTQQQVTALLSACKKTDQPRRDEAVLLFMLDTGARVSEVCALRMLDVDLGGRRASVEGKGGKRRDVYFSPVTGRALWLYLKSQERSPESPLFVANRGHRAGDALTRSGMQQLYERLGKSAGLVGVRCSCHTMRHTAAIEFIRAGGNIFALQQMLGHESLRTCQRYLAIASADVESQHRRFSPVERLKGRGKG